MSNGQRLPSYDEPPVNEVAVSLQFSNILPIRGVDLGAIAAHFADEYPAVEEHPPVPPIVLSGPAFNFSMGSEFDLPRLWFVNDESTRLVQMQRDRIGVNWRRANPDAGYPRYGALVRPTMIDAFSRLRIALRDLKIAEPTIEAIELTYVNPIELGDELQVLDVLRPWSGELGPELGADPDGFNLRLTFAIEELSGRMFVDASEVTRSDDGRRVLLFNLMVRAPVDGPFEEALKGVDIARAWIVKGFTSMTTPAMHKLWKRVDDVAS